MKQITDKELLELAAKAAGLKDPVWDDFYNAISYTVRKGFEDCPWNPLNNDSEAFNLAADLRLAINPGKHIGDGCTVETQLPGIAGVTVFRKDPAAQMRRAIVMAAAEIGKTL